MSCVSIRLAMIVTVACAAAACDDGTLTGQTPGFVCPAPPRPPAAHDTCNGAPRLCDRRYDEVAYLTAHNAMSNQLDGWFQPNQRVPPRQLAQLGARAFALDVHYYGGDLFMCHAFCQLGRIRLAEALCELNAAIAEHPDDVFTLLFESYVDPADLAAALVDSGIAARAHTQVRGAPWPTLREMIAKDERVVIFVEEDGGTPAWLHAQFDFARETRAAASDTGDLDCTTGRGDPANGLFILNHFLTDVFGSEELAEQANRYPVLEARVERCMPELSMFPNFVVVDFMDVGDAVAFVDDLNAGSLR